MIFQETINDKSGGERELGVNYVKEVEMHKITLASILEEVQWFLDYIAFL